MTMFQHVDPNDPNVDLDVHPAPVGLWQRVGILGLWSSKEKIRKSWPDASVVGPLRSMRGIDLLFRSLLANPQLRVVVLDGPDLRPDVTDELHRVFSAGTDPITGEEVQITALPSSLASLFASEAPLYKPVPGDPLFEVILHVLRGVKIMTIEEWDTSGHGAEGNLAAHVPDEDRPGGASFFKPPKVNLDVQPHGDPGQRVVGDTLAEVWPRAMEQAIRFGRVIGSQHGGTREVIALTSVIRDPARSLDEFMGRLTSDIDTGQPKIECDPHPVLGFTWADVVAYHEQLTTADKGERTYSYGSRMRGTDEACPRCLGTGIYGRGTSMPDIDCPFCRRGQVAVGPDQIDGIEKLLGENPGTRGAYLTPWRAAEDAGKKDPPCLVGVWFRMTPDGCKVGDWHILQPDAAEQPGDTDEPVKSPWFEVWSLREHKDTLAWGRVYKTTAYNDAAGWAVANLPGQIQSSRAPAELHMVAAFRSHCLFEGFPTNAAGLCLWLVNEAKALGVKPGVLTVHSYSAHVYARDLAAAKAVVDAHPAPMISWDARSSWRIRVKPGPEVKGLRCATEGCERPAIGVSDAFGLRNCCEMHAPLDLSAWEERRLGDKPAWMRFWSRSGATAGVVMEGALTTSAWVAISPIDEYMRSGDAYAPQTPDEAKACVDERLAAMKLLPLPRERILVAEALTPGEESGDEVIWTCEAPTPGALRLLIDRSGLLQSTGGAMWLGSEIERVWGGA